MKPTVTKGIILATVILMDLLTGTEGNLFVPSFAELKTHFNLTPFWVEALLSVNFMGFCLSLFFIGHLADRYGRRPIILLGLFTFIMGSVLCLWGNIYLTLLIGRFFQGIGIAAPAILSFLIIADNYPIKQQQFLLALLNGALNIAAATAPVIGSYVTQYYHWQGNFLVLLWFGLIVFIMTFVFIPAYKLPEQKEFASSKGYVDIFHFKPLIFLMAYFIVMYVPYWIFIGMSPLLYIKDLGVSLSYFGYYQGSFAFVFALGSIFFGFMLHRYNQRKMLHLSNLIFFISLISTGLVTFLNTANPLFITLAFLPFVIGQIMPSTILYPLCLEMLPQAKARITAIMQGGRLIFASLCLQIAGYFYQGTFKNIGIIICGFIFVGMIMLSVVIRNRSAISSTLTH